MSNELKQLKDCIIVIFGASGDLTQRKLIPSLYNLFFQGLLPQNFSILGISRTNLNDAEFQEKMKSELREEDQEKVSTFLSNLKYLSINTKEASEYVRVKDKINEIDISKNCIFYLSTPPAMYSIIPKYLAEQGLHDESNGWKRIIIEKPFGTDLTSAQELNQELLRDYKESQIYRIDHYLGKETVQNILVFRFSNMIFEPLWDSNHIDNIQITGAESIGIEKRGGYYDKSGAIKDMIQNHLLQVLGIVAMEPPVNIDAVSIRNETIKVFQSIRRFTPETISDHVVLGQYLESTVSGTKMNSYRDEEGVDPNSRTETFASVKFYIDNWRWKDVPFYVRTGKRLPTRVSEIVINFKKTPHPFFKENKANQLIIRIQPNEGILLKFRMKKPGGGFEAKSVNMDFHYSDLSEKYIPTAYERLLMDSILGDSTLYARNDAVEECWKIIDPIIKWRDEEDAKIFGYPSATWGPHVSDDLLNNENHKWRQPCKNLAKDGEYCEL